MEQKGYSRVLSAQPLGIGAELITIEADLSRGLHAFSIVGLADKAMVEARDRISSAIKNTGFKPPKATNRRIVLSLSPANLPKDGSHYDLPLALAYLAAAGYVRLPREKMLFCGELGLDGSVRQVRNVLAHAHCARESGIRNMMVPASNARVQAARTYAQNAKNGSNCSKEAGNTLRAAAEQLALSPRGFMRTLRVARTISLLAQADRIELAHVLEALQYRPRGSMGIN